jgi:hypothetical protein
MKSIPNAFKFLAALTLAVLVAGCASNHLLDKENVAVAAGFKVITPSKPEQVARLRQLPADKVTRVVVAGKPYYILPDVANNQAYVGGPKQYQVYLQDRRIQKKNSADAGSPPANIEVVEVNDMGWGDWDSWNVVGGPDGLGSPGWY